MAIKFGLLTVSDSCSAGKSIDTASGKLQEAILTKFPNSATEKKIVPDEKYDIIKVLEKWVGTKDVIFTIGGTGFSPRDITPEATRCVIEREAPGLAYAMISRSLLVTEMAMLSRPVCGICGKCLIVNLPGSAKAAVECFGFIKEAIPHAVTVLRDNAEGVSKDHKFIQHGNISANSTGESKVTLDNVARRPRHSPYALFEVDAACKLVQDNVKQIVDMECIPFEETLGRVLAEDVFATEPIPSFRASMKDGYAVRSSDGGGPRVVISTAAAGDKPIDFHLQQGQAVRISTGGPVPEGADAVVQVEDTEILELSDDNQEKIIKINVAPAAGQEIRSIGSDICKGTHVMARNTLISPASVGVFAMLGKTQVLVYRSPSVGVLSTGNEIRNPREQLEPGQIYDCNKYTLMNLLKQYGFSPTDCGFARDTPNSVKGTLQQAFANNDVLVTSGGVSMGEFDIIKQVLIEDFGAVIHFARVNMKPGKPTTFATLTYDGKQKIFFGLPGNPVSCSVTCILFVIPALKYMVHLSMDSFPVIKTKALGNSALTNNDARPEYHRVHIDFLDGEPKHTSTGNQISSRLNSMVGANGLSIVKKGVSEQFTSTILFEL